MLGHPRATPSFALIEMGPYPAGFPAAELGKVGASARLQGSHFVMGTPEKPASSAPLSGTKALKQWSGFPAAGEPEDGAC